MPYVPIEKLLQKKHTLYRLVLTAAKRATELSQGIPPLISTPSKKITTIALEEIAAAKVTYEIVEAPKSSAKDKEKDADKEA